MAMGADSITRLLRQADLALRVNFGTDPLRGMRAAIAGGVPHVLQLGLSPTERLACQREARESFCRFAAGVHRPCIVLRPDASSRRGVRYEHSFLDSVMGSCEPGRIETGLSGRESLDHNYAEEWLVREAVQHAADLEMLFDLPSIDARPSFIQTNAQVPGGPLHKDDYDSLVHVYSGRKVFYLVDYKPHERWVDGGGEYHEHLDALPGQAPFGAWRVAELMAGDVLYVPRNLGHYVVTDPSTISSNLWW